MVNIFPNFSRSTIPVFNLFIVIKLNSIEIKYAKLNLAEYILRINLQRFFSAPDKLMNHELA